MARQQGPSPQLKRSQEAASYAVPAIVAALALVALGRIAAPLLRGQVEQLLPALQRRHMPTASSSGQWSSAEVVQTAAEWKQKPGSAFTAPVSRCSIAADGEVQLRTPNTELPFLFNLSSEALPSKAQSCGHCDAPVGDACNITRLPHTCCGVCQFDSRFCSRLYKGEGRSEAAAQQLLAAGFPLHDFTPCELFQRIRGRTLWFVGDSQTWHFYYALECFLREFAPSLRRSDPVPAPHMPVLATARQMYCKKWWPVPPECLELAHGTRVCIVRADTAGEMVRAVLPTLMEHVPGFQNDLMVYNTGLHYQEFDGNCSSTGVCEVPGPGSKYLQELEELGAFRAANRGSLPATVWMDTPPQHFPGTGYYVGEFHADCVPWKAWQRGDALARGGGMWNVAARPYLDQLADAHLRTWNASVPLWDSHMPDECTHWCQPSAYHLWLLLLNDVMRQSGIGGRVLVQPAAPRPQLRRRPAQQLEGV